MATILLIALIQGLIISTLIIVVIDKWHLDTWIERKFRRTPCRLCISFWLSVIATAFMFILFEHKVAYILVPFMVTAIFHMIYK